MKALFPRHPGQPKVCRPNATAGGQRIMIGTEMSSILPRRLPESLTKLRLKPTS